MMYGGTRRRKGLVAGRARRTSPIQGVECTEKQLHSKGKQEK
jgi:hypothetical protein